MARYGRRVLASQLGVNLPLSGYFHGTWVIDGDGAGTNGGGMVGTLARNEIALTEAAAAYCKAYDAANVAFGNLATSGALVGYGSNYQLFSDAVVDGDAICFGASVPFCEIVVSVDAAGTPATYDAASVVAWTINGLTGATLTIVHDNTDADDQSGGRPFQRDGAIDFIPPAAWELSTIGGQSAYWICAAIATGKAANMTQVPISDAVEHSIVTPVDGLTVPVDCYITAARAWTEAATVPTATDVKFVIMNFTTGVVSNELTWAQDKGTDSWTGITGTGTGSLMTCAAGDVIGILITQEDGTNELSNVHMNFTLVPQ